MTTNLIGNRETIEENYEVQGADGTPRYRVKYEKRTSQGVLRETAPSTTKTPHREREYVYIYDMNSPSSPLPGRHIVYVIREGNQKAVIEGDLELITDDLKSLPEKIKGVLGI